MGREDENDVQEKRARERKITRGGERREGKQTEKLRSVLSF